MSADSQPFGVEGVPPRSRADDVLSGRYTVVFPGNDPLEEEAGIEPLSERERRQARRREFDRLREAVGGEQ